MPIKLQYRPRYPFPAATGLSAKIAVKLTASQSVTPCASINDRPLGFTVAAVASGADAAVLLGGVIDAVAAAAVNAGDIVGVGTTTGRLAPYQASGGPASVNQVAVRWSVGIAAETAADGATFKVIVDPKQII